MADSFDLFQGTKRYIASPELRDAVNVAVALARPLLVRGEPGTGKTLLAENVAEALGLPLIKWYIKSTTKAAEGLYVYDTVARLHDSRFGDRDVRDIRQYIRFGPLGEAFRSPDRVVLLIDEIDKADLEFPNDLLRELDEMRFAVAETGDEFLANHRPVVIITSNNEKELPDAFLRRCVFHFIEFPDAELMARIVRVHHPDLSQKLLEKCLERFYWMRENIELRKPPSTSELIDWIAALRRGGLGLDALQSDIPFLGTLIKKETDFEIATAAIKGRTTPKRPGPDYRWR
jgi:MoxR-like ATPase